MTTPFRPTQQPVIDALLQTNALCLDAGRVVERMAYIIFERDALLVEVSRLSRLEIVAKRVASLFDENAGLRAEVSALRAENKAFHTAMLADVARAAHKPVTPPTV